MKKCSLFLLSMGSVAITALPFCCLVVCQPKTGGSATLEHTVMTRQIEQVSQDSARSWMTIPGVIGCGVGELHGKPCIIVMVIKKTSEIIRKIPAFAEGYPVVIENTGAINALDTQ